MAKKTVKKEALSVARLITEVLINQLGIPARQIVNDTTFVEFTGSKRPDLLISNVEYDGNNHEFIKNLLCYVEAKDETCNVDDRDWQDAYKQGMEKAPKLGIPFFGVTNCRTTYFYNTQNGERITLNGKLISEFQTLDVFRIIKNKLDASPSDTNIKMGVDSLSSVSEAVFNKKLWELQEEYRAINITNDEKINLAIGLIALEYYEEKAEIDKTRNDAYEYWSDGRQYLPSNGEEDTTKANKLRNLLITYIDRLTEEGSGFEEFRTMLGIVKGLISGADAKVKPTVLQSIYSIVDSMRPMHGAGFDLFGAVYEQFASSKEKKDFGQYFTRRHYAHVLAELLLKGEDVYDGTRKIKVADPTCGTGGMLTESFKVLRANYDASGTLSDDAQKFLSQECFYGLDIKGENISRTKLNMFLVGDGHTNMFCDNSLVPEKPRGKEMLMNGQYDYIITNPPYGAGTILAPTDVLNSYRMEVAFLCKNIDLLKINGKACIITPDGILENPSFKKLREEIMSVCTIDAIISLPKFAFAPYTKEKTYAIFLTKKHNRNYGGGVIENRATGKFQSNPVWMYIIDNDGYANSDKRFPTRLRNENQQWLHDEVSGYSDNKGMERKSLLVQRWMNYDDSLACGTEWMTDKGETVKLRKGGFVQFDEILNDTYFTLLPEKYLRPYEPHALGKNEFVQEYINIKDILAELVILKEGDANIITSVSTNKKHRKYQALGVKVSDCIGYDSGHSGLTEEFIYSTMLIPGERFKVKSSATLEETLIGYVPKCKLNGKDIHINERNETLLIARNGTYVGQTEYLVGQKYTINDHAYILYVKDNCPYKINLKWFSIQYKADIMNYTSSSANGTWNMTGFFNNVIIDIPSIEEQLELVDMYEKAETLNKKICQLQKKLKSLLNKEIQV